MLEQQALCHTQLPSLQLSGHHRQHMHSPLSPTSRALLFSHTLHSLSLSAYNSQTLYARKSESEIPHCHMHLERLGMYPCNKGYNKYQRNWSERGSGEEGRSSYGVEVQDQPLSLCSSCSWLSEHGILQSSYTTP